MRQCGILAAAGRVALMTIPPLLAEDHAKILRFSDFLQGCDFIKFDPEAVKTNILIFRVDHPRWTATDLSAKLAERDILCHAFGPMVRLVTYRDITETMVDQSLQAFEEVFKKGFQGA